MSYGIRQVCISDRNWGCGYLPVAEEIDGKFISLGQYGVLRTSTNRPAKRESHRLRPRSATVHQHSQQKSFAQHIAERSSTATRCRARDGRLDVRRSRRPCDAQLRLPVDIAPAWPGDAPAPHGRQPAAGQHTDAGVSCFAYWSQTFEDPAVQAHGVRLRQDCSCRVRPPESQLWLRAPLGPQRLPRASVLIAAPF